MKRTPLYEEHLKLNAKMVPFAGWEMPVSYKGIIEEHNAVRNAAGVFDIGHMGLIKIEGDRGLQLIQRIGTNDASKLEVNQGQYSVLCNESGGTIDDIFVYRLPMHYLLVVNASNTEKDLNWIKEQAAGLAEVTVGLYENYCSLAVQGPQALSLVGQALSVWLNELKHNHLLWWRDIIISRTGYTGEDGVELIVAKSEVAKIWSALLVAGCQPCGLGARDTLRLEAGYPLYGHEYDEETSPLEAGYGWAVKFDKGKFIGRAALLKQKELGPKKKLVGLSIERRSIPREKMPVFCAPGSVLCGQITSGTFSPTLKQPIALAYVSPDSQQVEIEIRGEKVPAAVVAKTFYKR